jgi:hypothetical protein
MILPALLGVSATPAPQVAGTISGGTVTNITGYEVHTFTASGTLTVTGGTATVEYLVAGGGGANGLWSAEDAGAGGLLVGSTALSAGSYAISVGAAGTGAGSAPTNGGDSSIAALLVAFGGGHGTTANRSTQQSGANGGCGGAGQGASGGGGTGSQGGNGGTGYNAQVGNSSTTPMSAIYTGTFPGAGGGAGGSATGTTPGVGASSSITGAAVTYGAAGSDRTANRGNAGSTGVVIVRIAA